MGQQASDTEQALEYVMQCCGFCLHIPKAPEGGHAFDAARLGSFLVLIDIHLNKDS